ncbi:peroxiredoxin, partial [Candidatus Bipolaricaulota bacterium]|nr:peroxiredoxin [Candidatus Bipolaricaulota bacterium]
MQERRLPLIGDPAPEFRAQTTHGPIHFPKDYEGKWVVLFSHPADFTPVCTTEFVAFQKRYDEFKKLGCELIGLSIDQVFSHIKWVEWIKEKLGVEIKFPVIADNTGKIGTLFGMLHPEAAESQTVRAVFVIDPKGIVRAIIYYPLNVGRNMDEILRLVRALQLADKEKAAIPAGWPNNELIGDRIIVPPPASEEGAKGRLKEAKAGAIDCYDWWFCHKKLS